MDFTERMQDYQWFTPRTDNLFPLHDLDLPGRADEVLICMIYSSSCCLMGAE